ncbi:hypothetical protein XAC3810_450071 [Xanthomonas citri pv. citri]|uniref:Uncharacterized protein n=1 Tax=Xanthomonas citri pv. citri TaxID=611301 RepID=A0A0U4YMN0_XANCI|nr:hypothetical protein XAC3824_580068 [Xanthomonas citri pv. citri]CEE29235.1 hypothetical protein XAC9322_460068 [Xanthomonas citri pv. citri]CEE30802.1 hypothetical protein XAC1083_450068 [Xanthomonas citri pv. citri]CEE40048.1 hypothetical protein XAC3810_450071 [Xanthomonas citri pv. citri]CEE42292.1 hypothetical protein XAC902_620069 [Xanthomonas citri pv. citri]
MRVPRKSPHIHVRTFDRVVSRRGLHILVPASDEDKADMQGEGRESFPFCVFAKSPSGR